MKSLSFIIYSISNIDMRLSRPIRYPSSWLLISCNNNKLETKYDDLLIHF